MMTRNLAVRVVLALMLLCGTGLAGAAPGKVGVVNFENSGAKAAQADFLYGLAQLHNFEYASAAEAFRRAQKTDPGFAMAYWGEAMTYNHPVWFQQDLNAARAALAHLAATPEARQAKARSAREKDYLHAVEILYGEGSKQNAIAAMRRRWKRCTPNIRPMSTLPASTRWRCSVHRMPADTFRLICVPLP